MYADDCNRQKWIWRMMNRLCNASVTNNRCTVLPVARNSQMSLNNTFRISRIVLANDILSCFQMRESLECPTSLQSLPKDLCLTWKNISYTVEKRINGSSLRSICGLQRAEFVQLLNKGTSKTGRQLSNLASVYTFFYF